MSSMLPYTFSAWTRDITGASGTFPAMQLAGPVILNIYPLASSSLSGLEDPITSAPLATVVITQGASVSIAQSVTFEVLAVMITNPYPNSRHLLLLESPSGSIVKLTENDLKASAVTGPAQLLVNNTAQFSGDGTYTIHVLSQTPTDVGYSLVNAGIPAAEYTEPTVPGYGWVSLGSFRINYIESAVTINSSITSCN